jgi:hypothetical protein
MSDPWLDIGAGTGVAHFGSGASRRRECIPDVTIASRVPMNRYVASTGAPCGSPVLWSANSWQAGALGILGTQHFL